MVMLMAMMMMMMRAHAVQPVQYAMQGQSAAAKACEGVIRWVGSGLSMCLVQGGVPKHGFGAGHRGDKSVLGAGQCGDKSCVVQDDMVTHHVCGAGQCGDTSYVWCWTKW